MALPPRQRSSLLQSFGHAWRGLCLACRQRNMRIHLTLTAMTIAAGILLSLGGWQWAALALAIGMGLGAETMNSAIETLADAVTEDTNPKIRDAKDMAAGAVLAVSLAAFSIALLVLGGAAWQRFCAP